MPPSGLGGRIVDPAFRSTATSPDFSIRVIRPETSAPSMRLCRNSGLRPFGAPARISARRRAFGPSPAFANPSRPASVRTTETFVLAASDGGRDAWRISPQEEWNSALRRPVNVEEALVPERPFVEDLDEVLDLDLGVGRLGRDRDDEAVLAARAQRGDHPRIQAGRRPGRPPGPRRERIDREAGERRRGRKRSFPAEEAPSPSACPPRPCA